MTASTSSDTYQWLGRLEIMVGDIHELLATMTTRFEQLSEDCHFGMEVGSNNKNKGARNTRIAAGTRSIAPKIAKLDFPKYC